MTGSLAVLGNGFLILRAGNDRTSVIQSLRAAAADTGLSLGDVTTFDEVIGTILMPQRLGRALLTFLGALALVLASVGIYGLVSCAVARTEMEIGLRRALGASDADVMRAIAKRMLWPVVGGLAGGAAFAWWGGRFADRFMYGLKGHPKTGQRRSPQNRPMKAARDQVVLPRLAVIEQACVSTPTPWATLENVTMMEEAVEHGGHGRTIP